jgi:hypothetical protein
MQNYKIVFDPYTEQPATIHLEGIGFIPFDPANTDYQAYLAWVAEGNTAEEWTGE